MNFTSLEKVYEEFTNGNFVIVLDEHREEEGDFFALAESITAEKINFLLKNADGLICVACDSAVFKQLNIPLMVVNNEDQFTTNFGVSVNATTGVSTGISAPDRARTIQVMGDENAVATDLVRPGHVFPLLAQDPTKRFGHTECAVELAKKCGKRPVTVACEILNEDGEKANKEELFALAEKYNIAITTLEILKAEFV
jgi:3,4-dihydroxy 2-butanone 4-phosphate synthase / GTP cyclohydrolase II